MARTFEYVKNSSGLPLGGWLTYYSSGDAECPFCGKPMDYRMYQSGQSPIGNDEYEAHFVCDQCDIATVAISISPREFFEGDQW